MRLATSIPQAPTSTTSSPGMAPDRGFWSTENTYRALSNHATYGMNEEQSLGDETLQRANNRRCTTALYGNDRNFTIRGILVGLAVGLIICFSNTFFGLQTGWVSSMSMPSSLIGFAIFKTLSKRIEFPFTPVENVLVQTVAGSMGTMPLGCGFVGVMPALNYMLRPDEGGPVILSLWKMTFWALGLCYFGVVFAVPLRRQVIIREKLKFPSGTATALMIGVLHSPSVRQSNSIVEADEGPGGSLEVMASPTAESLVESPLLHAGSDAQHRNVEEGEAEKRGTSWEAKIRLLLTSFIVSGLCALSTYFFPVLRSLPVFGTAVAQSWMWTLNPSLAYVGQGIIMGPATTIHMLIGAVIGWGVLSPLAKAQGWAPGPVDDWETGSKGWIVWISLAIMLADSVVNLGYLTSRSLILFASPFKKHLRKVLYRQEWFPIFQFKNRLILGYTHVDRQSEQFSSALVPHILNLSDDPVDHTLQRSLDDDVKDSPEIDMPPEQLVPEIVVWTGLIMSILCCIVCIHIVFGALIPLYATVTAVFVALVLSVAGVRALGETDLNPVSGISKIAQMFFALIVPKSNKNAVLINLIAGAVSEAGALQAGDLMQDLKTGHILGASPKAQFWGQIIGSTVGAVVSAMVYKLYTSVYSVPGDLFEVPTGFVWIFTARLVTGEGLPPLSAQWALGAAVLFTVTTSVKIAGNGRWWHPYIPGGIAVAVGMYNIPSFTLARSIGGILSWYWQSHRQQDETLIIILASGLILGEGVISILNLIMASLNVPHL